MSSYVYRLYDGSGALLYVGKADDVARRLGQHRRQPWWPEVVHATQEQFASAQQALEAEDRAIAVERPKYNVAKAVYGMIPVDRLERHDIRPVDLLSIRGGGHLPAPGTQKVCINIRTALWSDEDGLKQAAEVGGVDPVAVIEALLLRYLNNDEFMEEINVDASRVMRDRRRLAAQIRMGAEGVKEVETWLAGTDVG